MEGRVRHDLKWDSVLGHKGLTRPVSRCHVQAPPAGWRAGVGRVAPLALIGLKDEEDPLDDSARRRAEETGTGPGKTGRV